MIKEITIPEIGEKVESGQVVGILVKVGDVVESEQGIIEFETDKAVVEIPSPARGKITELTVKMGDKLKVGATIGKIETETGAAKKDAPTQSAPTAEKDDVQKEPSAQPAPSKASTPAPRPPMPQAPSEESESAESSGGDPVPASPSVRRLARELGIDIRFVAPSGPGGRITDEDVKHHVKHLLKEGPSAARGMAAGQPELPDFAKWGEIERIAMSSVRSAIARSTTASWSTIPHVTQYDDADVTHLNEFLKKHGKQFEERGTKVTLSAVIMKVLAAALKEFPRFNATLDFQNGQIIFKKYYHIGVAVDTPAGLLAPVLRDVDKKSLTEVAAALTDLATRARDRKLSLDELEGGTFTISNQGAIGGVNFSPIVLWPQVAILGVSRTAMRPVWVDNQFQPRQVLPLALSYDHRIIDGADAVRFLKWVCEALEQPLLVFADL